jgi:Cu2+-exporting ATPase
LTVIAFCFTIPVVVLSWADPPISERTKLYISLVLATIVQAIAILEFYQPALSALIYNRVVKMDMLVVISITAAYAYSIMAFALILASKDGETTEPLFETSTLLISLILLGRLVAAYARKRAVDAVSLQSL